MSRASWTCVFECAALHRDAKSFLLALLARFHGSRAEVAYFARPFDVVCLVENMLMIRCNGILHCDTAPAVTILFDGLC